MCKQATEQETQLKPWTKPNQNKTPKEGNFTVVGHFGLKYFKYLVGVKKYYRICLYNLSNGILSTDNIFLLHITCRMLRAKARDGSFMNHFKRTEVLQMIGSRTIPVGFQLETMSYHTFRAFVMIVICQVGLKQTMAFVVDEKLNAALIFNLHFCGFYNIAQ